MAEPFVGGFNLPPPSPNPSVGPPPPPKDVSWLKPGARASSAGNASWSEISRTESTVSGANNSLHSMFANMSAVERSNNLRVARMSPYLQFMAGPLLRYDTVTERGVWRGAAMVVSEYRAQLLLPGSNRNAERCAPHDSCGRRLGVRTPSDLVVPLGPQSRLRTRKAPPLDATTWKVLRPGTPSCRPAFQRLPSVPDP